MITYNILDDVIQFRDVVDTFFNNPNLKARRGEFPHIEVYEGTDKLEITAVVPGVKTDELNIQLVDNSLLIEGEKNSDYKDSHYIRKERLYGKFKRSVQLPYRVNAETIKADLKNGILKVMLEKSEDAKPKKISIQ